MQRERQELASKAAAFMKRITSQEIQLERLRLQIHETLQKAEVEEISLPVVHTDEEDERKSEGSKSKSRASKGSGQPQSLSTQSEARSSVDSALRWGGGVSSVNGRRVSGQLSRNTLSSGESEEIGFSQSEDLNVQKEGERIALVDLSSVRDEATNLSANERKKKIEEFRQHMIQKSAELETLKPNMRAVDQYDGVVEKLKDCTIDMDKIRAEAKDLAEQFDKVKSSRHLLFQECFTHVSKSLAVIYRDLTQSSKHPLGGNAYLTLDNADEMYTAGIRYTAMPPSKRFRDMDQLSGGEKTVAALALLFAIHSFRQAPFFVLDEVDAALDNVNVQKVCNYIRQRSKHFQCVVISLKDMFFEHADMLIGVCKDVQTISSQVLTLDLNAYPTSSSRASRGTVSSGATDSHRASTSTLATEKSTPTQQRTTSVRGSSSRHSVRSGFSVLSPISAVSDEDEVDVSFEEGGAEKKRASQDSTSRTRGTNLQSDLGEKPSKRQRKRSTSRGKKPTRSKPLVESDEEGSTT